MKIETSKSVLKVCGVIDMIYGILVMLLGVLTTAGGGLISAVALVEADSLKLPAPWCSSSESALSLWVCSPSLKASFLIKLQRILPKHGLHLSLP